MNKVNKYIILVVLLNILTIFFTISAYAVEGWQKNESGQWVYYENEIQVKKRWICDAHGNWFYVDGSGGMVADTSAKINSSYYMFDENGCMQSGGWCSISKTNSSTGKVSTTWCYADFDGKLYTDGWYQIEEASFYFSKDGRAIRGGIVTVNDQKYYVDHDKGKLGVGGGWFSVEDVRNLPTEAVRTTWYYAVGEDGSLLYDGWKTIDGARFYFGRNGNVTRAGIITVNNKKYYIDSEKGCLGEGGGWFSVDITNRKGETVTYNYYANEDGSLLYDGWYVVDGVEQYFDKGCVNYKNIWFTLDGQRIFVDATGARQQPGWFSISGADTNGVEYTHWYYLDSDLNIPSEGFHEIDGHIYYFDKNGINYRNRWYVDGEARRYYLDEYGHLQNSGWFSIITTNAKTGIETVTWCYAKQDGSCLLDGFHDIDGKTYYFSTFGVSFRKRWLIDEKKRRRYFNEDGYMERNSWFATESTSIITGPATLDMSEEEITTANLIWYYADENGYVVTGDKIMVGDKEYKFNANGIMFTGWDRLRGTSDYYYYKEDGSKAYGWQLIKNPESNEDIYNMYAKDYGDLVWFYFNPAANGRVARSAKGFGEQTIDGRRYCTNKRGMIQYGWVSYGGTNSIREFSYFMPVETGGISSVTEGSTVDGDVFHSLGKDGFLPGEKVTNHWVWTEAPYQMTDTDKSATWYYITAFGTAEHANPGKIQLKDINGLHAFDEDGRTYSGFGFQSSRNLPISSIYYFDVDNYNTAVTGVREIEMNGVKEIFRFDANGEGVTGVYDGYLYYKGRRQIGNGIRGVSYAINEEMEESQRIATYLVDGTGKIISNANGLESNGGVWSSDDSGIVIGHSANCEKAKTVSSSDMRVFIGNVSD